MATDAGLRRLFEKPLPENSTLLEALSAWNHVHHKKPVDQGSFTEIFGELHFQEKPDVVAAARALPPPPPRTVSWLDVADAEKSKDDSSLDALLKPKPASAATVKRSASFCMKSSKSLLLCTEGLGSESTEDADDMAKDGDAETAVLRHKESTDHDHDAERRGSAADADAAAEVGKEQRPPFAFPPPIRSIGRGGKPSVCFRSFRAEGRFVLMEVVIPGKELLQASREGGRLRLQFANAAAGVGLDAGEQMELGEGGGGEAKNACVGEIELDKM